MESSIRTEPILSLASTAPLLKCQSLFLIGTTHFSIAFPIANYHPSKRLTGVFLLSVTGILTIQSHSSYISAHRTSGAYVKYSHKPLQCSSHKRYITGCLPSHILPNASRASHVYVSFEPGYGNMIRTTSGKPVNSSIQTIRISSTPRLRRSFNKHPYPESRPLVFTYPYSPNTSFCPS
jgi:hypothetical protein